MRRVLWITGRLPYPLRSGDALYTAGLVQAAHAAGYSVTVIGLARTPDLSIDQLKSVADVEWRPVRSKPRHPLGSLLSTLPKDAYCLYPSGFRLELGTLLAREWDWIVLDHARSAGALDQALAGRDSRIAYVAHNVEQKVRREVAAGMGTNLVRAPYVVDAGKYCRLERKLVRAAASVIAITAEDANDFRLDGAAAFHVPPVYLGPKTGKRVLDSSVPRRVMLLGSFDWVAKQSNLIRFLDNVGTRLVAAGVGIDIVGSIPHRLRDRLQKTYPGVDFRGSVDDVCAIAQNVRCGVIPEELGGGMKMKTLDYIFMRVPIFSLPSGVIGLPSDVRSAVFTAASFAELGDALLRYIDDPQELDARQSRAFEASDRRFCVEEAAAGLRLALDNQA